MGTLRSAADRHRRPAVLSEAARFGCRHRLRGKHPSERPGDGGGCLQEKEVAALGLQQASAVIKSRTKAGYYPGTGEISVKLLAEQGSGRLLGGQIVGMEGSAKRVDTVATALHAGFTVEEMINLDFGYAPPFSPVWDPVVTAARVLAKKL